MATHLTSDSNKRDHFSKNGLTVTAKSLKIFIYCLTTKISVEANNKETTHLYQPKHKDLL